MKYKNKGWLKKQYVENNRSVKDIAEEFDDRSYGAIFYYVKKFDLEKEKKYKDESWLREKYEEHDRSIYEIAELCDVTPVTIYNHILQSQIEMKTNKGENHYRWNKNSNTEWHKSEEGIEWRTKVFKRDNWKCQICDSGKNLNAHHIIPKSERPELKDDVENGVTVCKNCHGIIHKLRGDNKVAKLLLHDKNITVF